MISKLSIAVMASVSLVLVACDSAILVDPGPTDNGAPTATDTNSNTADSLVDLIATAEAAGNFTTLLAALETANLRATLADTNNINTVFAPTDSAFEALGEEAVNALLADSEQLTNTLLYHVLAGSNDGASLSAQAGTQITMLNGSQTAVTTELDQIRLNTSTIIASDIAASNGIIHVLDAVLIPSTETETPTGTTPAATGTITQLLSNDPQFSTLQEALTNTGLDATLSLDENFTLFAPTNDAFSAIDDDALSLLLANSEQLRNLLLYHVVDSSIIDSVAATASAGKSITSATGEPLAVSIVNGELNINNATITQADMFATNGVVHAIDTVLTPPGTAEPDTIVGVLSANPDYSSLVSLLTQAGLVNSLNNVDAEFTLFAPNNDAIAAAQMQLAAGFTNDTAALGNMLLGHLHGGRLTSAEVIALDGSNIEMAIGSQPVVLTRATLSVGGAIIVDPDLQSRNGIIHGISSVILP